ncbi:hypothetical protein DXG03_007855 [Asterophora parasitica]|uniref:Uncharacterized protein n=1 Tax=Asterophora parasitica TaxID=117018 RepID=A0A9P7KAL3_9AGAR|nr:hypothetical protein DXG03_007855 [Asterophora parasitica]
MDPEAMEEFKEQHAKVAGFQDAMANGDLKSGLSAFMGDEQPSKPVAPANAQPTPAVKNRGTRNKKR